MTQRRLTQAYQREQLAIVGAALRDMARVWPAWQVEGPDADIDASWQPVLTALLAVGAAYHRLSASRARAYYSTARRLAGVEGEIQVPEVEFDEEAAVRNLMLLGPILTKKAIANRRPRVKDTALVRVSGAVTLMVMRGGRDTIVAATEADPASTGFMRVTAGTCSWCLQLAAWGKPVGSGPGGFLGHTNCKCVAEPRWDDGNRGRLTVQEGGPFDTAQPLRPLSGEVGERVGSAHSAWYVQEDRFIAANGQLVGDMGLRSAAKSNIASRLGAKMEARFSYAQLKQATDAWPGWVNPEQSIGQQLASKLVQEWASTSGDSSPHALAMQRVAAQKFDLPWPPAGYKLGLQLVDDVDRVVTLHGEILDGFLEEMYRETQDMLDAMFPGQTHVPMARGFDWRALPAGYAQMPEALANADFSSGAVMTEVMLNPLSSFSVSAQTARGFGQFTLWVDVPKERIIGSAWTGFGCMSEYEFVVLGGKAPEVGRWTQR